MIEILIASVASLIVGVVIGRITKRTPTPEPIPPPPVVETGVWCDVCRQPANPLRTHLGNYRCTTHKLT